MKARSSQPRKIKLNELPEEGEQYTYSQESGELNADLSDLFGNRPYRISLRLSPMGDVFQIEGEVDGDLQLQCARCGEEVPYHVHENFRELLIVEPERPRNSRESRPNHSTELTPEAPFCNHLERPELDVGAFFHEQVASAEPYVIYCEDQQTCKANYMKYAEKQQEASDEKENPFSVLAGFKPNKRH